MKDEKLERGSRSRADFLSKNSIALDEARQITAILTTIVKNSKLSDFS